MSSRRKAQEKYIEKMPVIGIRIEKHTKEEIERIAKDEGVSVSDWIRKALKEEIERIAKDEGKGASKRIKKALKNIVNYKKRED